MLLHQVQILESDLLSLRKICESLVLKLYNHQYHPQLDLALKNSHQNAVTSYNELKRGIDLIKNSEEYKVEYEAVYGPIQGSDLHDAYYNKKSLVRVEQGVDDFGTSGVSTQSPFRKSHVTDR